MFHYAVRITIKDIAFSLSLDLRVLDNPQAVKVIAEHYPNLGEFIESDDFIFCQDDGETLEEQNAIIYRKIKKLAPELHDMIEAKRQERAEREFATACIR